MRTLLLGVLSAVGIGVSARAQSSLSVLRYTPADTGSSGSLITVTFTRPVAGMLGQSFDARKVMSVSPATRGTFEWRDPSTVRFIPEKPLAPGTHLLVRVDTAAAASAGHRSGKRYEFTIDIPGATALAQSVEGRGLERYSGGSYGPLPVFRVLYSGEVNLDSVAQKSRLEFGENAMTGSAVCHARIQLRAVRQRAYIASDRSQFQQDSYSSMSADRDTVSDRFRRVAEFAPVDSLPPGCYGEWIFPARNTPGDRETRRYNIHTLPKFRVNAVGECTAEYLCTQGGLRISFTSPVADVEMRRALLTTPTFPTAQWHTNSTELFVDSTLTPGTRYTVAIDSTVRDIYGRNLEGPTTFTVVARNRPAGVVQQIGLMTVPRTGKIPTVQVRTINADTLLMTVIPIPDSVMESVLATEPYRRFALMQAVRPLLRDTMFIKVPVTSHFNEETNVVVPIPDSLRPTALTAVSFAVLYRSIPPDSVAVMKARRIAEARIDSAMRGKVQLLPPVKTTGVSFYDRIPDFGLIVQSSALAIHSRISDNSGAVFVTDLSGNVVSNAAVTLYRNNHIALARGESDTNGLVTLKAEQLSSSISPALDRDIGLANLRYLEVAYKGRKEIAPVSISLESVRGSSQDSREGMGRQNIAPLHGTIVSDRGIYRPGDMLYAKVFARLFNDGSQIAPVGDSVRVRLNGGIGFDNVSGVRQLTLSTVGDTLPLWSATLNEFGTASDSSRVSTGLRLGQYQLVSEVKSNGRWYEVGRTAVRVEEFRTPEFSVKVSSDTALHFAGDTIRATVDAQYLFGAPMAGATVQWSATSAVTYGGYRSVPNTTGFAIGENSWWDGAQKLDGTNTGATLKLDRAGHIEFKIPTRRSAVTAPTVLNIATTAIDLNNQTVTATASVALQGASIFIAARNHDMRTPWAQGVTQTIEMFVATADGKRVAGVPLRVAVLRRYTTLQQNAENEAGNPRWTADTIAKYSVKSTLDTVSIAFRPELSGAYDVLIEAEDHDGRTVRTNFGGWSSAPQPATSSVALPVQFVSHDASARFSLGDTARVTFDSPFESANAWITVEREGILEQHRMTVARGTAHFELPITTRLAPNAWIGVMLVKRGANALAAVDSTSDVVRSGRLELLVDSTAHLLRVVVATTNAIAKPGDSVRVHVTVCEASPGHAPSLQSEVTLWAVDAGVLSLTNYRTPDILNAIDRRLGVANALKSTVYLSPWAIARGFVRAGSNVRPLYDPNRILAQRLNFTTATVDFDDQTNPTSPLSITLRSQFRATAFFVGSAVTDVNGNATIAAKLPDNITTYRLMASAVSNGNRYGSGETTLIATRQFVVRPALPRFVRVGDAFDAAATINVREGTSMGSRVSISIDDALLHGDSVQTVRSKGVAGAIARFPIAITNASAREATRVTFSAINAPRTDGDAVMTTLPVRPAGTPRAHTIVSNVVDSTTISIEVPGDIDPDKSTISLSFGTSPIVAMRSHYESARAYPYYCTDAIVTAARALLALSHAERIIGEPLVTRDTATLHTDLQRAADELVRRQDASGDFAEWPGSYFYTTGAWMTAYAGTFLLDAQREGVVVPKSVFTRIEQEFVALLQNPAFFPDTIHGTRIERHAVLRNYLGVRLVMLRYLRAAGSAIERDEDALLANQRELAWEDRIALVDLLAVRPNGRERASKMLAELWNDVSVVGNRIELPDSLRGFAPFPSHIRPIARLLTATVKLNPTHPLIGPLAETLIQQSAAEGMWAWNTQDHGSAVEALAQFMQLQRGGNVSSERLVMRTATGRVLSTKTFGSTAQTSAQDESPVTLGDAVQFSKGKAHAALSLHVESDPSLASPRRETPLYYSVTVHEMPRARPVNPDIAGMFVERWYERFDNGAPVTSVNEGDLVRVHLRLTVPADREFVALEDLLPAGLEAVDLSLRTNATLAPFAVANAKPTAAQQREQQGGPIWQSLLFGSWDSGVYTPWEFKEMHDDRVFYFARQLWTGTYNTSYVARATTAGTFIRPPAHAEEMYNAALQGRSDGGVFVVKPRTKN